MRVNTAAVAVSLIGAAISMAGCAATTDDPSGPSDTGSADAKVVSFDITNGAPTPAQSVDDWCGDKDVKVGLAVGQASNGWMTTLRYQLGETAKQCDSIDDEILFTSAGGDQQRALSQINGMVAQGVNVLIVQPDFGAAQLPALRSAHKAGVAVVIYNAAIGGTPGTDYTAQTIIDGRLAGKTLGDKLGENLAQGNVVFLGGIPGNPASAATLEGVKDAFESYPDLKLLTDTPETTNWTAAGAQQAMAGLIAKHSNIEAIITDYGVTARGAIEAFKLAGKPLPMIATESTDNQFGCTWQQLAAEGIDVPVFSIDGASAMGEIALRQGVAAATGKDYSPEQTFAAPLFNDTPAGTNPPCDPTLPPDADHSAGLSTEQMTEIFG